MAGTEGPHHVAGDAQADLAAHGGEHRAVYVCDVSAYRHWERELARDDFVHGQFGENFTLEGLPDDEVCIDDRYRIGSALLRGNPAAGDLLQARPADGRA